MTNRPRDGKVVLACGERIVAVVPEYAYGPGWRNPIVWVYIQTQDGAIRYVDIQPDEQSSAMDMLFDIGAATHAALIDAVPAAQMRMFSGTLYCNTVSSTETLTRFEVEAVDEAHAEQQVIDAYWDHRLESSSHHPKVVFD